MADLPRNKGSVIGSSNEFTERVLALLSAEEKRSHIFTVFAWMEGYKPLGGWLRKRRLEVRRRLEGSQIAAQIAAGPEELGQVVENAAAPLAYLLPINRPARLEDWLSLIVRDLDWFLDMPLNIMRHRRVLNTLWLLNIGWATALMLSVLANAGRPAPWLVVGQVAVLISWLVAQDYDIWRTTMQATELKIHILRRLGRWQRFAEKELAAIYHSHAPRGERAMENSAIVADYWPAGVPAAADSNTPESASAALHSLTDETELEAVEATGRKFRTQGLGSGPLGEAAPASSEVFDISSDSSLQAQAAAADAPPEGAVPPPVLIEYTDN